MEQRGEQGNNDAAAFAAVALFQTVASIRPAAAVRAAQRVVLADLLTGSLNTKDRSATLLACLLADFGRIVLKLPSGEGAQQGGSVMRSVPGLGDAAESVTHRHERVDGDGLPLGLSGPDIPIGSRVVALTDLLVSQRWSAPIDWDRRLEVMKDSAGTGLDAELSDAAFDLLRSADTRALVEAATPGMAIAIIEHCRPAPRGHMAQLGAILEGADHPPDTAHGLAHAALSGSWFLAIGVQQVDGQLLVPVARAGDPAKEWAPLGVTTQFSEMTQATTIALGSDYLCLVPIRADGLWGFAWGVSETADFDAQPLSVMARAMETTIERQQNRQRLYQLAHCDELTGLANRRQLEAALREVFDHLPERRADVALVMCDVDGLKQVNDTRGHAAGDEVLRAVASALEAVTDGEDAIPARLGGDEFCILFRSGGLLRAQSVARSAADHVRTSPPAGTGLSCGIAYAANADTPSALLSQADEAQYLAKRRQPRVAERRPQAQDRRRRGNR